jgi:hypothetical protein
MTFFIIEIKVLLAQGQPMELILVPREINRVSHVVAAWNYEGDRGERQEDEFILCVLAPLLAME